MVVYGVYNSDTLEDLINAVHKSHNKTTWNEQLFAGQIKDWYYYCLTSRGVNQYAVNSILFLTMVREKYIKMYERFLNQLQQYSQVISFVKRVFTYNSLITIKIKSHFAKCKRSSTN